MALSHHKSERNSSEKGVVCGRQEAGRHGQTCNEWVTSDTGARESSLPSPSHTLSGAGPYEIRYLTHNFSSRTARD